MAKSTEGLAELASERVIPLLSIHGWREPAHVAQLPNRSPENIVVIIIILVPATHAKRFPRPVTQFGAALQGAKIFPVKICPKQTPVSVCGYSLGEVTGATTNDLTSM